MSYRIHVCDLFQYANNLALVVLSPCNFIHLSTSLKYVKVIPLNTICYFNYRKVVNNDTCMYLRSQIVYYIYREE